MISFFTALGVITFVGVCIGGLLVATGKASISINKVDRLDDDE